MAVAGNGWSQTGRLTFEVATIKLNESTQRRNVQLDPDTLTIVNLPLVNILFQAYEMPFQQFALGSFDMQMRQRYDIVAKTGHRVSHREMRLMLQNLLADRFHLATHHEERMEQGYALMVDK